MMLSRRQFLKTSAAVVAASGAAAYAAVQQSRPNFIIFLTDDQGYGDLGCMGAKDLATPNIDGLAARGAKFTSWYSNSPVCSPSRASLLTGRYPAHAGVRSILGGRRDTPGLPLDTPTLATALKKLGYHTGMFGKWHLGAAEDYRPHHHGFDEWFGFLAGCIDYYSHTFYWGMAGGKEDPVHDLWENDHEIFENGRYFTELITERATDFVRRATANQNEPFFIYVPYNAPHYPLHAPQKYLDRFKTLEWPRQIMAGMLSAVDDSIGAILQEVTRAGIDKNTCIFFQSDNGPSRETRNWIDGTRTPYTGSSAGPLTGHKFSLYEGGIRVPGIMTWPGKIPSGQVIDTPAIAMDIFPTFLQAAGGNPKDCDLDGIDIMPVVARHKKMHERDLFWELGKQTAIRRGNWKLVVNGRLNDQEQTPIYLSNVESDIGEKTNLADKSPDIVADLRLSAKKWRAKIDDMPV